MYTPDQWVVVKIVPKEKPPYYRVFARWYGSFLSGDEWKLNSGIVRVDDDECYYYFYGESGSVYKCHKNSYGVTGYCAGVLATLIKNAATIDIDITIELDQNFTLTL